MFGIDRFHVVRVLGLGFSRADLVASTLCPRIQGKNAGDGCVGMPANILDT